MCTLIMTPSSLISSVQDLIKFLVDINMDNDRIQWRYNYSEWFVLDEPEEKR